MAAGAAAAAAKVSTDPGARPPPINDLTAMPAPAPEPAPAADRQIALLVSSDHFLRSSVPGVPK